MMPQMNGMDLAGKCVKWAFTGICFFSVRPMTLMLHFTPFQAHFAPFSDNPLFFHYIVKYNEK